MEFTSKDFLETLGQYLGMDLSEATESGNVLDALAPVPDESKIKADMRNEFKDVLGALQEQSTKGYGEDVREAISSQQRQELADSARRMGGSQRMLSGRNKAAAMLQSRSQQMQQQAGVIQNVAQQEQELKESAKEQLQGLETSIAKSAQTQVDADRERRLKVGLSIYQLMELARARTEKGDG